MDPTEELLRKLRAKIDRATSRLEYWTDTFNRMVESGYTTPSGLEIMAKNINQYTGKLVGYRDAVQLVMDQFDVH